MNKYLINGVDRNKANPDTFNIPKTFVREAAQVGHFVRIGLEDDEGNGERFWVTVKDVKIEDGIHYVGTVDNHLIVFDLPMGEEITFSPDNVLDLLIV